MSMQHLSPDEIRQYWHDQALRYGEAPEASWSDHNVIEMEIREVGSCINDRGAVLDAGCGNGFSTIAYGRSRNIRIAGVDYTPAMIDAAWGRLKREPEGVRERVSFTVGDIRALESPKESFACVIATRVLINLGSWEEQCRALSECARVLQPGGLLLLSEAYRQGWENLNQFRSEWGLPEIAAPPFNLYIDEEALKDAAARDFKLVEVRNFTSTYFVGTRLLKPLLSNALGDRVAVANPNMHWNRWFASLPAWGDYGTQKLFVFSRT